MQSKRGRSFGTSKACRQCRTKRKKCDLKSPCSRCEASHISCSGPVDGALLVNRYSHDFMETPQRTALKNALMQRHYCKNVDVSRSTALYFESSTRLTTPYDASLDHHTVRLMYASLLDDFGSSSLANNADDGREGSSSILEHSTIMLCLRLVAGLGSATQSSPRILDIGIFSLISLYIGKTRPKHHQLINLSRRSYSLTVQGLHNILSVMDTSSLGLECERKRSSQRHSQDAFYLSLVLTLFELVDSPMAITALDMHIDGALQILHQIGPQETSEWPGPREILLTFRSIAYASAARRRLSLFLDEPQWVGAFSDGTEGDNLEHLYNIAVRLPRLLARTNDLLMSATSLSIDDDLNLLLEYTTLKSMFQNWYLHRTFRNNTSQPCHRGDLLGRNHGSDFDSDLGSEPGTTQAQTQFENMPHLSTMLIELDMGFADLLLAINRDPGFDFAQLRNAYKNLEIIDTEKLLVTMSEAVWSLSGSCEGQLVAAIPLDTLTRYRTHVMRERQTIETLLSRNTPH